MLTETKFSLADSATMCAKSNGEIRHLYLDLCSDMRLSERYLFIFTRADGLLYSVQMPLTKCLYTQNLSKTLYKKGQLTEHKTSSASRLTRKA